MSRDLRGWRVALVPDALLNPSPAGGSLPDVLRVLDDLGYGLLHVPPADGPALLLAVIADQIAEYAHHGYAIAAIGLANEPQHGLHWRRLVALLQERGASAPPRHDVEVVSDVRAETQRLAAWLAGVDLPEAERRRWRV